MQLKRRNGLYVFEDKPVFTPGILFAAAALLAAHALGFVGVPVDPTYPVWIGAGFFAFGAVMFFRRDTMTFDTARETIEVHKWSLFRSDKRTLRFDEVKAVSLQSIPDMSRSTWRAALEVEGGPVPLTEAYFGGSEDWEPMAAEIRTLLGATRLREPVDDIEALVREGRMIDAIRQLSERDGLSLTEAKIRVDRIAANS